MALNNTASEAKYNVSLNIDGTLGVLSNGNSEFVACHVETQLRIEVTGVGPTNEIQVYGRIRSSELWHYIATITGPVTGIADIATYDFLRYFHTVADGTGKLTASGFIFASPTAGSGSATAGNQVTGNNSLASIDSKTPGSLLANVKYDDIQATYPTTTIELYKYYLLGVLQATVELTYATSAKSDLVRARRI